MATRGQRRRKVSELETQFVKAGLPESIRSHEVVVASFRCNARIPRKSKIKGRLFLTQNFAFFKSEDCHFSSTIPLCQVRSAACHRSKKTKLFPSVVSVALRDEVRTFSHCGRRRDCTSIIEHLALHDPMTSRGVQTPQRTETDSSPVISSRFASPIHSSDSDSSPVYSSASSLVDEMSMEGSGRWREFVNEAEELVSELHGASPQRHAEAMSKINQWSEADDNNFDESEIDSLLQSNANYSDFDSFASPSRPDVFGEGSAEGMADCPVLLWRRSGTMLHPWMHYRRGFIRWHDYHFSLYIHSPNQSSQDLLNTDQCEEEKIIFYNEVTSLLHLSRPLHFAIETSDDRLVLMSSFARVITEHLLERSKQEVKVAVAKQSPLSSISPSQLPEGYSRPGSGMEPIDQEL